MRLGVGLVGVGDYRRSCSFNDRAQGCVLGTRDKRERVCKAHEMWACQDVATTGTRTSGQRTARPAQTQTDPLRPMTGMPTPASRPRYTRQGGSHSLDPVLTSTRGQISWRGIDTLRKSENCAQLRPHNETKYRLYFRKYIFTRLGDTD